MKQYDKLEAENPAELKRLMEESIEMANAELKAGRASGKYPPLNRK